MEIYNEDDSIKKGKNRGTRQAMNDLKNLRTENSIKDKTISTLKMGRLM